MINQQNMKVKSGSTWHTICPFPVGFIYMSANGTSPGSTFGGTWSDMSDSRFLRPAGSYGGTGGENSHVLSQNEMPSHVHGIAIKGCWQESTGNYGLWNEGNGFNKRVPVNNGGSGNWGAYNTDGGLVQTVGGGASHNNLPPYTNVYCWRRTA